MAIFLICVGVIIVVVGILNNEFYSGDIMTLPSECVSHNR